MNKVILIGNVGKDPEIRKAGENNVANFTLATTKKVKDETKTEWHNIVVWGKLSDIVEKYVSKGKKIMVEGEITYETYTDKDGNKKYITKITGNNIELLSVKDSDKDNRTGAELKAANDRTDMVIENTEASDSLLF